MVVVAVLIVQLTSENIPRSIRSRSGVTMPSRTACTCSAILISVRLQSKFSPFLTYASSCSKRSVADWLKYGSKDPRALIVDDGRDGSFFLMESPFRENRKQISRDLFVALQVVVTPARSSRETSVRHTPSTSAGYRQGESSRVESSLCLCRFIFFSQRLFPLLFLHALR